MSGGSYDYAFGRVDDMALSLRDKHSNPLRRAFAIHLALVAKAMHDIEWVDSCDYGPGDEDEAIRVVLSPGAELAAAVAMATEARKMLDEALERSTQQPSPAPTKEAKT